MTVSAWIYNDDGQDGRALHQFAPNQPVSLERLGALGVLNWNFNPATEMPKVMELKAKRQYQNHDEITIVIHLSFNKKSKEKLPNYEDKLKIFFTEHLHGASSRRR
jgi:1,2-dihydroxy-3-keto-5-methylthiopentene dioxygenase